MGEAFITRRWSQSNVEVIAGPDCFTEDGLHYGGDGSNPRGGYIDGLDFNKNDYIFFVVSCTNSNYFHTYYVKNGIVVDECHTASYGGEIESDKYITFTIESNERVSFKTSYGYIRDDYISMIKL